MQKSSEGSKYRNVLVARFSALGDVAMTIPVVYSLCRAYPDVHFVMATQPAAATLFIEQPSNLTVKGVDVKTAYRGFAGLWRLAGELDKESHFDAFADLHGVLRTDVLRLYFRLRGIAVGKIDKGRREKRGNWNSIPGQGRKNSRGQFRQQ